MREFCAHFSAGQFMEFDENDSGDIGQFASADI